MIKFSNVLYELVTKCDIDWIFEITFAKFYFSLVTRLIMKITHNTVHILIWRGKGLKFGICIENVAPQYL
jgi:hypothetical protein